jgi:hypothetical protein
MKCRKNHSAAVRTGWGPFTRGNPTLNLVTVVIVVAFPSVVLARGLVAHPAGARAQLPAGVCATVAPSPFGSNVMTNCDSTVDPHNETAIAVDPNDPRHLIAGSNDFEHTANGAFGFGTNQIGKLNAAYYTSTDGGLTWRNGHVPSGGFWTGDPGVAFDSTGGKAYFSTVGLIVPSFNSHCGNGGCGGTGDIQVSRSDDGGETFGAPVIVQRARPDIIGPDKPSLAVDTHKSLPTRDNIYVTWTQYCCRSYQDNPIYFSVSKDAGKTFSTPKEISGTNPTLCTFSSSSEPWDGRCREDDNSQIAVGPDGTIYVSFLNNQVDINDPTRPQILVVRSTDGGLTWSSPVRAGDIIHGGEEDIGLLSNTQLGFNCLQSMAVDPRNSTLYIVWPDNRNGTIDNTNADVFLVESTDRGATWSSPQIVSAAPGDQFFPWVAVSPSDGTVNVSFMDRSYDPASTKYGMTLARLRPGTSTFDLQRVDTGLSDPNHALWFTGQAGGGPTTWNGDYSGLAVGSDGIAHPIWTDMRRIVTVKGVTGTNEDIMTAAVR